MARSDPELRARVVAMLRAGQSRRQAAALSGVPRSTVWDWERQERKPTIAESDRIDDPERLASKTVRQRLRLHVARQIAVFDADLTRPGRRDTAPRILRDLSGLNRLLDEIDAGLARSEAAPAGETCTCGRAPFDLDAAREAIARRFEDAWARAQAQGEPVEGAPWPP